MWSQKCTTNRSNDGAVDQQAVAVRGQFGSNSRVSSSRCSGLGRYRSTMLLSLLFILSLQFAVVQAAVIEVTTTSGEITSGDGCSLPEAVTNANADAATFADCAAGDGADQIEFSLVTPATITLSAQLPQIVGDITIVGLGIDALSISGNNAVRLFSVATSGSLTISDIELTEGTTNGRGGAIFSRGSMLVSRTRFLNNASIGDLGGAINLSSNATLTVVDSEFIGNSASRGAAISSFTNSTITADRTLFETNATTSAGGALYGQNSVAMTVRQSLFVNNTSGNDGGAIAVLDSATATIETSTFSGSSARRGAILAQNPNASVTVSASTLTNNTSTIGGGALQATAGTITVSDSLIVQGTGTSLLCNASTGGTVTVDTATLGSGSCFGATVVDEADVNLLPLADNGGPTQTYALGQGSIAIDAIADCGSIAEDQRGLPRPSGVSGLCDAGAFELQSDPPVASDNTYNLTEDDLLEGLNLITDDTGDGVDIDVNGDELTVTQIAYVDESGNAQIQAVGDAPVTVTLAGGGLLTLDETGAAEFDPRGQYDELAAADNLSLTFSYTISDGELEDEAVVALNIAGVNDAPIAVADTYSTEASSTLSIAAEQGILANDSDIDGGALTVTSTGSVAAGGIGGTFNVNQDGSFSYDAPNTVGNATVDYTVSDGFTSVTGQVTIMVTASTVADLQISKSDGVNSIRRDDVLTYTIRANNNGPADVLGASVDDILPGQLSNTQWICIEDGASLCANQSGSGDISELVDLPNGSAVVFELTATVSDAVGPIENTATIGVPAGITDPDLTNNSATDINQPDLLFSDGFETIVINAAFSARQATVSKVSVQKRLAKATPASSVLILRAVSQTDDTEQLMLIHARRSPLDDAIELQTSRLDGQQWIILEWTLLEDGLMMFDW